MTVRAAWWCAVWVMHAVAGAGCAQMPTSFPGKHTIPPGVPVKLPPETGMPVKLPPEAVDILGAFAFQWTLKASEIARNPSQEELIKQVVDRLTGAAKQNKKYAEAARKFQWEVKLLKDDRSPNAFAFPNGKIGVYTGLFLWVTEDEEPRLAVALAHEFIHALARHVAERLDKELQQTLALAAMKGELKDAGISLDKRRRILLAMGLSQAADVLPFSRMHESEADHEGLLLMAQAGYNPQEAIAFWEQMERVTKGDRIPELLSTHPSYKTRNKHLKEWMPEAQQHYKKYRSSLPGKGE